MNRQISLLSYLGKICREYKLYFAALFLVAIIASFCEVAVQYQIKNIIDFIVANPEKQLGLIFLFFVLLKFMEHFMFFLMRLLDIKYKPKLAAEVTEDIYKLTVKHSLYWFDTHLSGEISDKINGFQTSLVHLISHIFRSFVLLTAVAIAMFFLFKVSVKIALIEIIFILIYTPIMYFLLSKQLKYEQKYTQSNQRTTGIINDSISNIFSIKTIGNIKTELKQKLNPALIERKKYDRRTRVFNAWIVDNFDTFMVVMIAATQFFITAYLFQQGELTAGDFAFVAMIVLMINNDLDQLLDKILFEINPNIASLKTSYEYINEKYAVIDGEEKLKHPVKANINFNNLVFNYPDSEERIFNNFNLEVKEGEKIGIVGASGAGKTTLLKCLLRYFSLSSGKINIGNNDITEISQADLLSLISLIPQDISMFHRTIYENLLIAKDDASEDEVIEACKKARIHDEIMAMPENYQAIVGERGVKLSGGQRQRLAIARAILKDAQILILDEATSSLDSVTERKIQESLEVIIKDKNKTVIAIAHRLSTLKYMDRIIVMEKGKICEEGTHAELIKQEKSRYKKLWDLQVI